jgi:hypothetical protein
VSKKGSHFPYVKQGYLHISAEWGVFARMMLAAHTSSRKASNYTVHEHIEQCVQSIDFLLKKTRFGTSPIHCSLRFFTIPSY